MLIILMETNVLRRKRKLKPKTKSLLYEITKGNRFLYFGALIAVGFATLISYVAPLIQRYAIDNIIGKKLPESSNWLANFLNGSVIGQNLVLIGISMFLLTLAAGLFQFLRGTFIAMASEKIALKLREKLFNHIQKLPFSYHSKAETGDLIQRCTSDVDTVRRFFGVDLVEVLRAVFMVIVSLIFMIKLDVIMTLTALGAVPFILFFSYFFYKRVKKTFKDVDESEGKLSAVIQENLTGVRVVRAFAKQKYELDKFEKESKNFRNKDYKLMQWFALFWSSTDFIAMAQIMIVAIVGTYRAATGQISLGTLNVFVVYEGMLLWPVRQMGRILTDMGKAQVALGRINEILHQEEENLEQNPEKPNLSGEIKFNNVEFEYEPNKKVLDGISFNVKPGQTVAILGKTGSGKTTLMNLLPRLYDYTTGSIKINGIELKDISKKWIRKNVGIVLQEAFLFSKTIQENIALAIPNADETQVFDAAKIAAIHSSILEFEKGYETKVGERGVTLSGGQKQRIAIARTIMRDCPILVFDDSLSAVDTKTDSMIRQALYERKKDGITFIIAHRITTLSKADFIIVMEDGKIAQIGTHDELLKQQGLYKRIADIQTNTEEEYAFDAEDTDTENQKLLKTNKHPNPKKLVP